MVDKLKEFKPRPEGETGPQGESEFSGIPKTPEAAPHVEDPMEALARQLAEAPDTGVAQEKLRTAKDPSFENAESIMPGSEKLQTPEVLRASAASGSKVSSLRNRVAESIAKGGSDPFEIGQRAGETYEEANEMEKAA